MNRSIVGIVVGILVVLAVVLLIFGEKIFKNQPETLSPDYSKKTTVAETNESGKTENDRTDFNNSALNSGSNSSASGFYKVSYQTDSIDMFDEPTEKSRVTASLQSGTVLKAVSEISAGLIEVECLNDRECRGWVDINLLEEIYGAVFYMISQNTPNGGAELYGSVERTPTHPMPDVIGSIPTGTLVSTWGGETEEYIEITCDVDGVQQYGWVSKEFLEMVY